MKKECETCVYCRNGICRDEACAGCFEDLEHANYEPKKSDDKTKEDAISILAQVHKILVNSNSWGENTHEPLNMAFDMAIKALEQTRWIPVGHKLPEKGKQVLCCNKHGSVFTSAITYIKKYKDGNQYVCFGQHRDVIAWMSLPPCYNSQESEET